MWHRDPGWSHYKPPASAPTTNDRETQIRFGRRMAGDPERFDLLFGYFLTGFLEHASADFARVNYPGMASTRGYSVNGLEGFARTAPLLGAWVYSRRGRTFRRSGSQSVDLVDILRTGVLGGTDPRGSGYWGKIGPGDQRIVEAADIARLLWLTKTEIWDQLDQSERKQIANWLGLVNSIPIRKQNNWLLFPVVINSFLKRVGQAHANRTSDYYAFKKNYLESGWFRDGPNGKVDFYNTWGIPYDLYWIHLLDPSLDGTFIRSALLQSARLTTHLISPAGIPIMGRSICYRTAVPVPVLAGSHISPTTIPPGQARRALDATWSHFIDRGILRQGTMTLGYYQSDPRLVDNYSGAGSCHWGLRSLTLAYMSGVNGPFWRDDPLELPIETKDYDILLPKLGWQIVGRRDTQDICIRIAGNSMEAPEVREYRTVDRIYEFLARRPHRPRNTPLKYGLKEYCSRRPLGGIVSADLDT